MRIININPLTIKRTKIMTKSLIPWVGYVRMTYSGLVILKAKWWSFRRTRIPVTDLYFQELPKRIADSANKRGLTGNYFLLFKEAIGSHLELQFTTNRNFDISEYIWDMYNKYHKDVPLIEKIPDLPKILTESNIKNNMLPVLSLTSFYSKYGVHRIFRNLRKDTIGKHKSRLVKRIKKIQNNIPMRIYRFSGLVFG